MTLQFIESFDIYGTGGYGLYLLTEKWNGDNLLFNYDLDQFSSTINRNQEYSPSYSIRMRAGNSILAFNAEDHNVGESGIVGFAILFDDDQTGSNTKNFLIVRQTLSSNYFYRHPETKCLVYTNNSNDILCSGTTVLENNKWYYVELEFHNSRGASDAPAGACKLWLDGVLEDKSPANAKTGRTNTALKDFRFLSADGVDETMNTYYDDFYVVSKNGTHNTGCLGDVSVRALKVNNFGDNSTLVGQDKDSVSNNLNIDDTPADDGTTHNSGLIPDVYDLYKFNDCGDETATIYGLQTINRVKEDIDGSRVFCPISKKLGESVIEHTYVYTLNTQYQYFAEILETDPETSTAWTAADIVAYQFGLRVK
jgi:hypothetical protein